MLKYLEIITFVLALGPKLIDIISAVEKMFPEGGAGDKKIELIKGMVQSAFELMGNVKVNFDEVWPVLKKIIDSIVGFANAVGLFKKNA
jgi:hypothetical protein